MIPKKPAPDLIRGGHRFSEKIMLHQNLEWDDESKKSHPAPAKRVGYANLGARQRIGVDHAAFADIEPVKGWARTHDNR